MRHIIHANNGYILTISDDTEMYIADSIHIEADPEQAIFDNDYDAARAAERDGIKLIYGMEDVPDGVYVDLPCNREVIRRTLSFFPGYRYMYHYSQEHHMEEHA